MKRRSDHLTLLNNVQNAGMEVMVLRQNIIDMGRPIPGYDLVVSHKWVQNANLIGKMTDILVRRRLYIDLDVFPRSFALCYCAMSSVDA